MAFAPTRSGKGVGLVVPTLLGWSGSAVIHDIKGENWQLTAGWRQRFSHCLLFNPTDARSARYNPLLEVRRGTDEVRMAIPFVVAGIVIAVALARTLNAIALGDESARSLGAHAGRARIAGAAAITLLAGSATAAAGPIAFVGLTVPHVARAITGSDQRWVLGYSAVLGAILVLFADTLGRVLARPGEVQAAIVMAFIGVPIFIAVVRRRSIGGL